MSCSFLSSPAEIARRGRTPQNPPPQSPATSPWSPPPPGVSQCLHTSPPPPHLSEISRRRLLSAKDFQPEAIKTAAGNRPRSRAKDGAKRETRAKERGGEREREREEREGEREKKREREK